jgi:hypothetical protein
MIAPNAFTKIWMYEDGEYPVNVDADLYGKKVAILQYSGITASVKFVSYKDAFNDNMLYGFNLYQNSSLVMFANAITVDAPNDAGEAWGTYASCVRVYDGVSNVVLATSAGITFSATPADSGAPSLVMPAVSTENGSLGFPVVQANGTITTNSLGYVLNSLGQSCVLNSSGTIDDADYWVENGAEYVLPAKIDMTFSTASASLVLNYDSSTVVQTIYGTDSDATILSALTAIFAPIMGLSSTLYSVDVVRDGTNLQEVTLYITGTGASLPAVLYGLDHSRLVLTPSAGTINNYDRAIHRVGKYEKNYNVLTNIEALK